MSTTRRIGVFGLSIEDVASRLSDRLSDKDPHISLIADVNEVSVLLTADNSAAVTALDELTDYVRDRLGIFVYGVDVPDLQHRVVALLLEKGKKIATAESCTAGILSGKLTEVSGVSAVFECGVASYSKEIKHSVLGVPSELLENHGAVSEEVAAAMATGVRRISDASFGIGITGVAGPSESEGKPVGTVYISLADEKRVWVKKIEHQHADREAVRLFAVMTALDLARRYLEALPGVMAGVKLLTPPSSETMVFPVGKVKKRSFFSPLFPSRSQGRAAVFRAIAIWLFLLCFLAGSAYCVYRFVYRPLHNEQIYDRLESVYYAGLAETSTVIDTSLYPEGMLSRFYALYDQNQDIRGWIKIDDTTISYPVMDSRHSTYYASHDFDLQVSEYGVPYFDSSADFSGVDCVNRALTVYGNQVGKDQMFSPLLSYVEAAFYANHEYLSLNTLYSENRYQVCAVFEADSADNNKDFNYTVVPDEKTAFQTYVSELEARSFYKLPQKLRLNDELLFLSVDAPIEDFSTRRIVVVAKKLAVGAPEPAFKVEQNESVKLPHSDEHTAVTTPHFTTKPAATTAHTSEGTTTTTVRSSDTPAPPPTTKPAAKPTVKPTTEVTTKPTTSPTTAPTAKPTTAPTTVPTTAPTTAATTEPTVLPTVESTVSPLLSEGTE